MSGIPKITGFPNIDTDVVSWDCTFKSHFVAQKVRQHHRYSDTKRRCQQWTISCKKIHSKILNIFFPNKHIIMTPCVYVAAAAAAGSFRRGISRGSTPWLLHIINYKYFRWWLGNRTPHRSPSEATRVCLFITCLL